jgi:regulator of protease activity HflC (stomatin/prohibitin superfamily)
VKIVERLGKYHRTAEAGLNTIVPFLDSIRTTIDLREQITKIEPQPVITRDNVTMEVDAVIYYLIADPVPGDLRGAEPAVGPRAADAVGAAQRHRPARSRSHAVLARHDQHAAPRGARHRDPAMGRQGDAHRAEEHHAARRDPPDDGEADDGGADAPRRRHHRRRREVVGDSPRRGPEAVADRRTPEGAKEAAILAAEGQAQARLRIAQAEAQAIQLVVQALGSSGNPAQYLIAQKYLEALGQISTGAQKLVFMPYEASGIMASLGGIKELLQTK